ncbi:dTMP kinase [Streptomyces thermolineatus]|uniref:dTMP kinase n=1 Tax=Streptomyces thermolineatus TaxID=44033 RepID=UPI00384E9BD1
MTRAEQPTDVTDTHNSALVADSRERAVRSLLRIPRLHRLWTAQFAGAVADRLALLVLMVLAFQAAAFQGTFGEGYRGTALAVAAVVAARLVSTTVFGAVLLGPLAHLTSSSGALDRRWTMIGADLFRLALLVVAPLWIVWLPSTAVVWLLVTVFLLGAAERVWTIARDGAAPALLPVAEPFPAARTSTGILLPELPRPGAAPAVNLVKGGPAPATGDLAAPGGPAAPGGDTVPGGASATPSAEPAVEPARPAPAHLEALHRLDLRTAFLSVPAAAALLVAVTLVGNLVAVGVGWFHVHQVALASYLAAGLFAASVTVLYFLELPGAAVTSPRSPLQGLLRPKARAGEAAGAAKGRTGSLPLLVAATACTAGAVAAATALALPHAVDLGGGPVGFGLLALMLTGGPALGIRLAPRLLPGLSRRRLLALAVAATGLALLLTGIVPDPATVLLLALLAGVAAGVAANTGHTLVDQEVEEARRARTTDHLHAVVRVLVGASAVAAPVLAALIGPHRVEEGAFTFEHGGAAFTLMLVGALLLPVAALVLGRADDRQGVPLRRDLREALRGGEPEDAPAPTGYFIALEGGDGAGKSTQVEALATWIRAKGHEVVVTREPGATALGKRLRSILLDVSETGISHRAEALLYAADRAEHVESVLRPALERGAVVISDRYIDSSVAYQGAGRDLSPTEIARISRWATGGLVPHLTVLLDVSPETARERFTEAPDRLESEPAEFHRRVRSGFLTLAAADPSRYLVVDAGREPEAVTTVIRHRLDRELPLSEQEVAAREEARRRAEEERKRREEEERRRREEEERAERERQEQLARLRAEEAERKKQEEERKRREEEERQAAEARRRAEEARRQAEEERRRREAEEAERRAEQERLRRQKEEQDRLRAEAEARRLEKQRKAEEALRQAEEARRRAEEARRAERERIEQAERERAERERAEQAERAERERAERAAAEAAAATAAQAPPTGQPSDSETTVPTPVVRLPERDGDARTVESPAVPESPAEETAVLPRAVDPAEETAVLPRVNLRKDPAAVDPAEETAVLPQVDLRKAPAPGPAAPDAEETRPLPQAGHPDGDGGGHPRPEDPVDRVPQWMWRKDGDEGRGRDETEVERTRELPQVDPALAERRGNRPRPEWAEETPLDDLPSLADELLGPRGYDEDGGDDTPSGRGGRGRRGRR